MASSTRKDPKPAQTPAASPEIFLYRPVMPDADATKVAWVYPADYGIAMSSLGYLLLFQQMDQNPKVAPERIYANTLNAYDPRDYELMGFSFSFELDIAQILKTFETYRMPFLARDRGLDFPLVFAGGPVIMSNPEPFADFFDFFLIGEGEEMLNTLIERYRANRHIQDKTELLHLLSVEVPGLYAPSMYDVRYESPEGPVTAIVPKFDDLPGAIEKQMVTNLDDYVASTPIISDQAIFSSTFLVEVMRGCAHRCRFCLASYTMLPARGATLDRIIETIERGLQYTHKVGLLGALISNHPHFPQLCEYLDTKENLSISTASLRADTLTLQMAETFRRGGQKQVTIAVESGSERLRRRINKNLKHDEILRAARVLSEAGMQGMKVYGMVGLPDETDDDVMATAELMKQLRKENPNLKLHLGCSSFVPKAGTPFQWQARLDNRTIDRRFEMLRKALVKTADFRPQSAKWDYFQAIISRGDRRLAPFLVRFCELGGSLGALNRAYKELKNEGKADFPSLDWYALRERPEDEVLPWDLINLGVPKHILYKEGLPPPGFR